MRAVFLENEDSFSWNVIDALPFARSEITVVSGRDHAAASRAIALASLLIIGPGPLDPVRAGLVELTQAALARRIPLLGICLGHQALGLALGASLVRTPPMHGKTSVIDFARSRLFPGITGSLDVMRYHSLSLEGVVPPLRVIARTVDGTPMAIEHDTLPVAGLQFHPDSYATIRGQEILAAFVQAVT